MHYSARTVHSSDEDAGGLGLRVGRLVRAHRTAQDLSATELAERSGLSRTILARIERGEGNPSIGTLWRIARALRVPLGDLLVEAPAVRTRLIRAGEGETMDDPSGMVGRLVHTDGRERRTELLVLELPPGARRESPPHQPGVEELVMVTRGVVGLGPEGAPETLHPGDALWFAADVAHTYEATGAAACNLLCWMLYPPAA